VTRCVALLRGINVGRAKRIAMADLRALVEGLGFTEVGTMLNSGNVTFRAARPDVGAVASSIEAAIAAQLRISVPVVVVTERDLHAIVKANPLPQAEDDPSRFLVAFVKATGSLTLAKPLLAASWEPEAIALGCNAAYLWCANGIIESKLIPAFARATGEGGTTETGPRCANCRPPLPEVTMPVGARSGQGRHAG
jgi:uncharacterized protein (DUF1697 family)